MTYQAPKSLAAMVGPGSAIAPLERDYIAKLDEMAASMGVHPGWLVLASIDVAFNVERDENDLVFAVEDVMDRLKKRGASSTVVDAGDELRQWQQVALYLADCHATTAFFAAGRTSTSKSATQRLRSICERALDGLNGMPPTQRPVFIEEVREHLQSAIREIDLATEKRK